VGIAGSRTSLRGTAISSSSRKARYNSQIVAGFQAHIEQIEYEIKQLQEQKEL
jgi:hypothetical protein